MKPLDAALAYASRGWQIFPIRQGGKIPVTSKGFKDATRDPDQIRRWWTGRRDWDRRNIGVVCGPDSAMFAIDCDIDKETGELGEHSLEQLEAEHGKLPPHPIQRTPSGGLHHVFAWPEDGLDVPRRIRFRTALDVLGSGGYLLTAPSETNAGKYEWIVSPDDVPPPQAPAWLLAAAREARRDRPEYNIAPVRSDNTTPYGRKVLHDDCAVIASSGFGQQDDVLIARATRIGSLAHGGDIEFNEAFTSVMDAAMKMANQPGREPWTQQIIEKKVRRSFAHAAKSPTPRHEPKQRSRPHLVIDNEPTPDKPKPEKEMPVPVEWNRDLNFIWKDDGQTLKPSPIKNTQLMIEFHPDLRAMFRLNRFTDEIIVTRGLPGDDRKDYPRALTDNDETAIAAWLNWRGLTPSIQTVAATIREIASRHGFDPLRDYLTELVWDGDRRIDTWLIDLAKAEDTTYVRIVSRKALIAAVARALDPGCKVDTMTIFEGSQGTLKSTMIRMLCGAEFFTDQIGDVKSKDSSERLVGAWGVEIPEMDKFNREDINAVKDFLSRTDDRYRPSYGRNLVKRPRRCVFFGTINPDGVGYLKDTTGNRRFWPIKVGKIDIDGIIARRDQLWAEAVAAFMDGEEWWIADADMIHVMPEQDARRDDDIWEPKVREWLEAADGWIFDPVRDKPFKSFTSADAMVKAIGLELKYCKHGEKIRIAKILNLCGCKDVQHKNDIRGRSWEYVKK